MTCEVSNLMLCFPMQKIDLENLGPLCNFFQEADLFSDDVSGMLDAKGEKYILFIFSRQPTLSTNIHRFLRICMIFIL